MCRLNCANADLDYKGKCCSCTEIYAPVCGKNNKDYENECKMRCDGVSLKHRGKCSDYDYDYLKYEGPLIKKGF